MSLRRGARERHIVEIRIGIANIGRELSFETSDSAEKIGNAVADALAAGSPAVTFTDVKGATYIVPTASLAYVEVGAEETRRVGFVA